MSLLSNLSDSWFKLVANQLRLPSGFLAKRTGSQMNKANELLYHLTLNNLAIKDGENILEIGFGNGRFFSMVNAQAKNLTIIGIDHSPEMVKASEKVNRDLVDSGVLTMEVGGSDAMPFANNSFDRIFCINVIYFWDNPEQHLKEIYRVLKPGGTFCTGFRPKENLLKFPFTKFGFTLYSEEEWRHLLVENSFHFIKSENGKNLEKKMNQQNTPFESLCMVCVK